MYDLRYPKYVAKLLEGTEGANDELALRTALKRMFQNIEEEDIRLLYSILTDFDEDDEIADESSDMVECFIKYFKEENEEIVTPNTPAEFLDLLATTMMDEFDAYGARIPIPNDLM